MKWRRRTLSKNTDKKGRKYTEIGILRSRGALAAAPVKSRQLTVLVFLGNGLTYPAAVESLRVQEFGKFSVGTPYFEGFTQFLSL